MNKKAALKAKINEIRTSASTVEMRSLLLPILKEIVDCSSVESHDTPLISFDLDESTGDLYMVKANINDNFSFEVDDDGNLVVIQ